jgi:preprotein translocase subunit YajC
MYATVSAVDGDDVILEVAPGVEVRYIRRAVMEVISGGEDEETETVEDDQPEDADGYVDEDAHEDAEDHDHAEVHDSAGSAEEGLADSHDGNRSKSDKDNVF